jgi:hypothetical protein
VALRVRRQSVIGAGVRDFAWTGETELTYWDPGGRVFSLSFREGAEGPEVGAPRAAFGGRPLLPGPVAYVAATGRFLVATTVEGQATRDSLILVTNWQETLGSGGGFPPS